MSSQAPHSDARGPMGSTLCSAMRVPSMLEPRRIHQSLPSWRLRPGGRTSGRGLPSGQATLDLGGCGGKPWVSSPAVERTTPAPTLRPAGAARDRVSRSHRRLEVAPECASVVQLHSSELDGAALADPGDGAGLSAWHNDRDRPAGHGRPDRRR
jgi:hypothetical protein